ALAALTLLETGMAKNDPAMQKAIAFVRKNALALDRTYEISLALLLLDRVEDPTDKETIEKLALRLVAGQNATGGWSYFCPILSDADHQALLETLESLSGGLGKLSTRGKIDDTKPDGADPSKLPPALRDLRVLKDLPGLKDKALVGPS